MLQEWLTSDEFPGTRVLCRPFRGPEMFDLQMHGLKGSVIYDVLKWAVLDWEHLPLLGTERFSEKFDPPILTDMRPDVAMWVVTEVSRRMSSVSEDERKN
jgi:hypothetical protein